MPLNQTKSPGFKYSPLFVLIGSLIFIILFGLRFLIIHSRGTDIAGIEQNVIYSIQTFINNGTLYTSPMAAPFAVTQYTPFYYYLCGFTAKVFGIGPDNTLYLYLIGRIWDLCFNLITCALIYNIGRKIFNFSNTLSWFLALVSFAFAFAHNFAVRPDSLQDMLAISAIYCFLSYQLKLKDTSGPILTLALGVLLSAVAVFTKQSGIQVIIAYGCFCLYNKQWKTLGITIALSVICYGGLLAIFVLKYPYFLTNIVGGVANGISMHNFFTYVVGRALFVITVWPLIFIALYLVVTNKPTSGSTNADKLLPTFAIFSLVFATVTALKMGSTVQYYVLFVNLSVIYIVNCLAGKSTTTTAEATPATNKTLIYFQGFLVLGMLVFAVNNFKMIRTFDHNPGLEAQRIAAVKTGEYIKQQMAAYPDKYVFANVTTDYHIPSRQRINNILFRQCLVPQMDILQYSTGPLKVFGYKALDSLLQNGKVEYVVQSSPQINFSIYKGVEQRITANYKLEKNIDGYLIYKLNTADSINTTPQLK